MALRVAYYLFTKQKKGYKKSNPHQTAGIVIDMSGFTVLRFYL